MEVKVGIQHVAREVVVETQESAADVERQLRESMASGEVFSLADEKGRTVHIPVAHIAYVDLGNEHVRRVGFGAV